MSHMCWTGSQPNQRTMYDRGSIGSGDDQALIANRNGRASVLDPLKSVLPRKGPGVVEDEWFKQFIAIVIFASLVIMAGETDYKDLAIWLTLDVIILLIFIVEILLKLAYRGLKEMFTGSDRFWNMLEWLVIFLGIVELILWLCFKVNPSNMRLTRLVRLLRFFRLVKPLTDLATAYKSMLESFCVVLVVLFCLLLVCGIFCTYMLGQGEGLDMDDIVTQEQFPDIHIHFKDLPTSMFTLFQVCTLDNWIDIAQPAITVNVWWRSFFIVFIPIASWTMISILAAVASENVVESAMGRAEALKKEEEEMRKEFLSFLRQAFDEADEDGNGLLDKEEFMALIHKEEVIERMKSGQSSSLTPEDLLNVWDSLDSNKTGELTIDDFVDGFAMLSEGPSAKHIATFDYALQKDSVKVLDRIETLTKNVQELKQRNTTLIGDIRKQAHRRRKVAKQFWLWRTWVLQQSLNPELRAELEKLEEPPST